jgi:hypothetical protein
MESDLQRIMKGKVKNTIIADKEVFEPQAQVTI